LRQCPLEPERVADGEHRLARLEHFVALDRREVESRAVGMRDADQGQVEMAVDGDDLDVVDDRAPQRAVGLREPDRRLEGGLALDHVRVGDRVPVVADDDAAAERTRRGHLDHRRTESRRMLARRPFGEVGHDREQRLADRRAPSLLERLDALDLVGGEDDDIRADVEPEAPVVALDDRAAQHRAAAQPHRVRFGGGDRTRRNHLGLAENHDIVLGVCDANAADLDPRREQQRGREEERHERSIRRVCSAVHRGRYYTTSGHRFPVHHEHFQMRTNAVRALPIVVFALAGASASSTAIATAKASAVHFEPTPATRGDEEASLASHFGFSGLEIVRIDPGPGPLALVDIDGDGHGDIVIANNRKSRIELHLTDPDATPDAPASGPVTALRVNEQPPHWRYRQVNIQVSHQITALAVHDIDGDGLKDIIYAGVPASIVVLRQTAPGRFESHRRHSVRGLATGRQTFALADVVGDGTPEVIAIVNGRVRIWPLAGGDLGAHQELTAGTPLTGFTLADLDGDGRIDIVGIAQDEASPLRIWLGETASSESGRNEFGPQLRIELPPLRRVEPVRLPGRDGALLATIEQASRRLVIHELVREAIPEDDGQAEAQVYAFRDGTNRRRDVAVVDLDGNGHADLLALDSDSNSIVVHRQRRGSGFGAAERSPGLAEMTTIRAGIVGGAPTVFVLSEREGVVGRSRVVDGQLGVVQAIELSPGHVPVAMDLIELDGRATLAVVARENRDHVVDVIDLESATRRSVPIGSLPRSPEAIMGIDADQDGHLDLLVFTPDRPMTMLLADAHAERGFRVLESRDMGQFGLVQAAAARNVLALDFDGNGKDELLVADRNFIRALRYDANPDAGIAPGWQVVGQVNADDSAARLVALAAQKDGGSGVSSGVSSGGPSIVAADRDGGRLLVFARDGDRWMQRSELAAPGVRLNALLSGSFSGDGEPNILAVGEDAFAVMRLRGERWALREHAAWRSEADRRVHHEIAVGDINDDGLTDLILLDAAEQMFEILTFSEAERLHHATAFRIFESRLFTGGEAREFQPREAHIGDVTGDGRPDVVLLSHDRLLIYPQ